jgi:acid stress-induced BolA-like protein IbaG/YrbA
MPDSERQQRIWDALHEEYGAESVHRAGSFLAFTPEEWDLSDDSDMHE